MAADTLKHAQAQSGIVRRSAYADLILSLDAIHYYRLGEASGTVAFDSVGKKSGTYVNTPTLAVEGAIADDTDTAVVFDGINQYVQGPNLGVSGNHSAFAWFRRDGVPEGTGANDYHTIYYSLSGASHYPRMLVRNDGTSVLFQIVDGGGTIRNAIIPLTWPVGETSLIGHTFDGTVARIYRDGVEIGSVGSVGLSTGATSFRIGGHITAGTYQANGRIDDLSIHSRVLTEPEIEQMRVIGTGLEVVHGTGQAMAMIINYGRGQDGQSAQAQARIKRTYTIGFGQAQTNMVKFAKQNSFAQAQSRTRQTYRGSGQAQALVVA